MTLRLSEPQRQLLARLPSAPSDGARVKGPHKRTAQSLEAMGLARLVGASPVSHRVLQTCPKVIVEVYSQEKET